MLYDEKLATRYLQWLFLELDAYEPKNVTTIYVGGGTPSALNELQLAQLLKKLSPLIAKDGEFTIEVNVENLTQAKLLIMKSYGVNRLSIGVQSFKKRLLNHMNRHHDDKQVVSAIALAKAIGFANISIDLILDLPTQSRRDIIQDVKRALDLDVPHISTYSLTVRPGTVYGIKGIKEVSPDLSRTHYDLVLKMLRDAGYERYEVSNFSKPDYQGRHNLTYWNNEFYYAIGLGASGYLPGTPWPYRYKNTMNLSKYLQGVTIAEKEDVDLQSEEEYYLMLKLRLKEGFSSEEYNRLFKADFSLRYIDKIALLREGGLLYNDASRWYATDDGIMLLDQIILTLLS